MGWMTHMTACICLRFVMHIVWDLACIMDGKNTLQTFLWLSPRIALELTQRSFAPFKGATDDCVTTKERLLNDDKGIRSLSRILKHAVFGLFARLLFNPSQSSTILISPFSWGYLGFIKYSCKGRKALGQNLTKLVEKMRRGERELLLSCEGWQILRFIV